ncbi:MAG: hypothetical protein NTV01_18580 [Bacteroidia bacterium]|nr:hypothetical protein [Bacteroidia bacterium]
MALFSISGHDPSIDISWEKVDDGLYLSAYLPSQKSLVGDSKITILKVDPSRYNFNMFSAKENGESVKSANEWAMDLRLKQWVAMKQVFSKMMKMIAIGKSPI